MCVASLLEQDMPEEEYEIILVDDGSTDQCPEICDEYERMFDNIRVIHQKNGGLSAARNSGIEVAQGEYIMFVDSDDYIEPNVLKGLLAQIERDNLDVLRYRLQYVRQVDVKHLDAARLDSSNLDATQLEYQVFNPYKKDPFNGNDYSEVPTDGVSFLNSRMNTQCYAWQFVIKQELLDGCIFTPGIYFEDTDWTPRILTKANRVASTDKIVYNYLVREGSITNAVNRSKQKKVLDDKMHLIVTLQQQAIDLRKSGRYNRWYLDMISDNVVSIIGMLSTTFYAEKKAYLEQLKQLNIYPLAPKTLKAHIINLSPRFAVELLHFKNR
jgi:glycosyltransferase involved in cell wall biosynthesis